jgi:hypothetical protein
MQLSMANVNRIAGGMQVSMANVNRIAGGMQVSMANVNGIAGRMQGGAIHSTHESDHHRVVERHRRGAGA